MEKTEFEIICIKNCTCYYFYDIIKLGFHLDNILIDRKIMQKFLIYDISQKTFFDPKPLCIIFDKIDGFTGIYYETRYLTLFGCGKYGAIYNRIRCLKYLKRGIKYIFSPYFAKFKVDSYDSLPKEKNIDFA